jgi:hypothetical protein
VRKTAWVVSIGLLFITGVVGIQNGITQWHESGTVLQKSVTVGVFLYGVFGLLTAWGLFRRLRWSVITAIVWGVMVTYVPGAAVMGFGGQGAILSSAIAATAMGALVSAAVVWAVSVNSREVRS